ncbi:MAG: hypothetical protein ACKVJ2_02005 [Pseudomonadales bacterium]|jgi:hypothetical protein|tara:strand:+ start:2161 stop:2340 length:180 start_codon:yes stop_codon:yes gene_type:complete
MTRAKKKMPAVAGVTFKPHKKKTIVAKGFSSSSYQTRKQKGLATKKKQKSVFQQHEEES